MKLLHQEASPGTLQAVRLWVYGLWIFKVATDPLQRLADLPASFFEPVGVLALIPAVVWDAAHDATVLTGFRLATVAVLVFALAGRCQTPAALMGCGLLTFHQGLLRGVGYVNHAELPLLYAAFILAVAPLVDRAAHRRMPSGPRARWSAVPLVTIGAVLCLSYTFAAVSRLVVGAPSVFHRDTITAWILVDSHWPTYYTWEIGRRVLEIPPVLRWLLATGFVVVTAVELFAPCCLISRRFRWLFLAVMIPFHAAVFVSMNILFWENVALYVLLVDLEAWVARGTRLTG